MTLWAFWLTLLTTACLSVGLALLLGPLARRGRLLDEPGGRKVHDAPTPLTGGPALLITVLAVGTWWLPVDRFMQALLAGGLLLFLAGLIDDRRHLAAGLRFLVQVSACLIMIFWAELRLDDFGRLLWNDVLELGWLAVPITIFAALGVINAFNMIDGMDGLAGSIFLVAAIGMAMFAGLGGDWRMVWLLLLCSAAVSGFLLLNARLPWNPRARLFLGDSGSMLLGFVLAWCFIALGNDQPYTSGRSFMPITAVWLFAVPLLDTTAQIWRRWRAGLSAFEADQCHLHHAFLRAGFSVRQTWLAISLLALLLAAIGVVLEFSALPGYVSFWLFMAFACAYYNYMRRSWEIQRFLGRGLIYNDFQPPQP